MELVPTLISTGWASGVNAYATVLLLGLLGRAGVGEVPDELTSTSVLVGAGVMYAIEFVTDKVPLLDNTWDAIHTVIRPAIGSLLGLELAGADGVGSVDEALSAAGSGGLALVSHALKAGIRLGINASPEPVTNIIASLTEDGLVALVIGLVLDHPYLSAAIALTLLALGTALVVILAKRIRRALARRRERRAQSSNSA